MGQSLQNAWRGWCAVLQGARLRRLRVARFVATHRLRTLSRTLRSLIDNVIEERHHRRLFARVRARWTNACLWKVCDAAFFDRWDPGEASLSIPNGSSESIAPCWCDIAPLVLLLTSTRQDASGTVPRPREPWLSGTVSLAFEFFEVAENEPTAQARHDGQWIRKGRSRQEGMQLERGAPASDAQSLNHLAREGGKLASERHFEAKMSCEPVTIEMPGR